MHDASFKPQFSWFSSYDYKSQRLLICATSGKKTKLTTFEVSLRKAWNLLCNSVIAASFKCRSFWGHFNDKWSNFKGFNLGMEIEFLGSWRSLWSLTNWPLLKNSDDLFLDSWNTIWLFLQFFGDFFGEFFRHIYSGFSKRFFELIFWGAIF